MGLDVGTLTGQIAIEDQFSSTLSLVQRRAEEFAESFTMGMGGIATGATILVAAITAMTAAVTALAVEGSHINDVTRTFDHFAESAGGADKVLAALRTGTKGTVDDMALMGSASRIMSAGVKLSTDDFSTMSSAALVLKNRGLGPTKEMLDMISSAMVTGRTRTLAMRLGVVDSADTTRDYAASLGLLPNQLSATEKAEAKRLTVISMLQKAVGDAGTQELSFKDKLDQTLTSISNWTDELASAVASSPNVARAFDSIVQALMRFGDGKDLMQTVVGLVNSFADGVTTYGPPIIDFFHDLFSAVSTVAGFFKAAWDVVPDGVKKLGLVAGETAVAVYTLNTALGVLGVGSVSKVGFEVGGLATKLVGLRGVIGEGSEALGLAKTFSVVGGGTTTMMTAAGAVTGVGIAIGATAAVVAAGYQWWKLHNENAERAAADARQLAFDQANLVRLNDTMGTSFKTLAEAVAEANKRHKDAKPAIDEEGKAAAAAAAIQKHYTDEVNKIIDATRASVASMGVSRTAYHQLGDEVLRTTENQKKFTTAMDEIRNSGRALTDEENKRYETVVHARLATEEYEAGLLKLKGVTIENIDAAKALGKTEEEIAQSYHVATTSLKVLEDEEKKQRDLVNEVHDLELKWQGRAEDAENASRDRQMKLEIAALRGTVAEVEIAKQQIIDKYDLMRKTGTAAFQAIAKESISSKTQQLNDAVELLNHMEFSGNYFRSDIEKQKKVVDELKDALHDMGTTGVTAQDQIAQRAENATEKLNKEKEASDNLNRSLGNSITYDLSTQEGMDYYKRMNPTSAVNVGTEYFKTHTLQQAIQAGMVNPYGMFGHAGFIAPSASSPMDSTTSANASTQTTSGGQVSSPTSSSSSSGPVAVYPAASASMGGATFQQLNEQQAALWRASGGVITPAQQAIIDRMATMTPPGYEQHVGATVPAQAVIQQISQMMNAKPNYERGVVNVTNTFHVNGTAEDVAQKISDLIVGKIKTQRLVSWGR